MTEIGVAVIGLGFVGGKAHASSVRRIDGANLVAVSDLIVDRGQKFVDKYDCKFYQDHLEAVKDSDVDAVIVAVPTPYHYQVALDALKNGKHVLCEMPLTTTEEQSIELKDRAQEAGLIIMPVLNFRFTPNFLKAKELLSKRAIGSPISFTFREFIPAKDLALQWPPSSWAWDIEKSGGLPDYTLSVWSIDLIQWLFDSAIEEVHWESHFSPIEGVDDFNGYQTLGCARLANGVVGTFQFGSTVSEGMGTTQLEIFGNNTKTLRAVWNNKLELLGSEGETQEWSFELKGPRVWGHLQTDQYFVDCILKNKEPEFGIDDTIKIQRIAKKMVVD